MRGKYILKIAYRGDYEINRQILAQNQNSTKKTGLLDRD